MYMPCCTTQGRQQATRETASSVLRRIFGNEPLRIHRRCLFTGGNKCSAVMREYFALGSVAKLKGHKYSDGNRNHVYI